MAREELRRGLTLRISTPTAPHLVVLTTGPSTKKRHRCLQHAARTQLPPRKVLRQEDTDEARLPLPKMTTVKAVRLTSSLEGATEKVRVIRPRAEVTTTVSTTRPELRASDSTQPRTREPATTRVTTTNKEGVVQAASMEPDAVRTIVAAESITRAALKPAVAMATQGSSQSTRNDVVHTKLAAPTVERKTT